MLEIWEKNLDLAQKVLAEFSGKTENLKSCALFSDILSEAYEDGAKVLSCGNGGSHCDAMHFAEELTGRFYKARRPLPAIALGDPSHVTCTANDYGFDYIFERQVEALGQKGDVLLGLSTSGNSKNVILAVEKAKSQGMKTVALLGKGGGKLKDLADCAIVVPSDRSDRIQEIHIKLIHTVIETIERKLFPENY